MKNRCIYILICVISAGLLGGCNKAGSQLIGAWSSYGQYEYAGGHGEFFKNGSCYIEIRGQRISGNWSALDDGRLQVTMTTGGPGIVLFANVNGDELTIDEGGNHSTAYVRDGSQKAAEIKAAVEKAVSDREIQIEAQRRAIAENQAAQQREQARQMEAQRAEQARQEETNRLASEREQEIQRSLNAAVTAFKQGMYPEGIIEYQKAIDLGSVSAMNDLAWHCATCKDPAQFDGKKALNLALQATKLKPDNAEYLDTLAAAYARNGQFEEAARAEIRALSINSYLTGAEDRLKLYRENKAYQEQ